MAQQHSDIDFLPDRLNSEPPVFLGLSNTEMFLLLKVGMGVWMPVCLIVAFLLGKTILGFGVGFALAIATVAVGGKFMQKLKRGRPEGYHERLIKIRLQDRGLANCSYIRYSGAWDVCRRQPIKSAIKNNRQHKTRS